CHRGRAERIDAHARLSGVPFRLLGLAAHPDGAGDLCGQAFGRYAAAGTEITLVCAAARDCNAAASKPAARRLGVRDLVLLDFLLGELTAAVLEEVFVDVMASLRPHVVVADETQPAIREASASAFERIRREIGGSAALPAKLYYRPSTDTPAARITTVVGGCGEQAHRTGRGRTRRDGGSAVADSHAGVGGKRRGHGRC